MGEDQTTGRRRVTVAEASEILGVTVEAVRGRIKRGTLEHERDSGTVYVLLPDDQASTSHQPADNRPSDQMSDALADELRDRVRYLERQVEEEREARRRADTLLAQLMQRIPELEAPDTPRESPTTRPEASEGAGPRPAAGGQQEDAERPQPRVDWPSGSWHSPETDVRGPGEAWDSSRQEEPQEPEERLSWWRRWFGG